MKFRYNKMNRKGSVVDILVWVAMSFVIIMFFATWVFAFNLLTVELTSMDTAVLKTNISTIAQDTFGQINPVQTRSLHILAFVMIFMMGITIMLSNFIVRSHPAFIIVFVMVIIAAVMVSVIISNQYEKLLENRVIGTTLQDFSAASFIMINLPIWVTVFGFGGLIFLFMGIMRDAGVGGSIA